MKPQKPMLEVFGHPPYCPNDECSWHEQSLCAKEGKFSEHDRRPVQRYPYITIRFRCANCQRVFSNSVFSLFYRDRLEPNYREIFEGHQKNQVRRDLAVDLGCSVDTIQRRFRELARQGLLIQAQKSEHLQIHESVAYDGIENFAFSQFDPNNVNHVIGRKSFFLYDFNYSPLNRKGTMSALQKRKKRQLENKFGSYPRNGIQSATVRILLRLLQLSPGDLLFHSDKHYMYREAIKSLSEKHRITHFTTSSKIARNFRNRLFTINHADNLTRQKLATFKRETISFAKHSIAMIESFSLFMVWKNFMRTIFLKKHKRDPLVHIQSPAMRVGIENKVLDFAEFYRLRLQKTQVNLNEDWLNYIDRIDPTSRRKIAAY